MRGRILVILAMVGVAVCGAQRAVAHPGDGTFVLTRGPLSDAARLPNGTVLVTENGQVESLAPDGRRRPIEGFRATGIEVAHDGSVLGIDDGAHVIRRWAPGTTATVVAGVEDDEGAFGGDGGPATEARLHLFDSGHGLQPLRRGGFRFTDTVNGRVREVDAAGTIRTVASGLNHPMMLAGLRDGGSVVAEMFGDRLVAIGADGRRATLARGLDDVDALAALPNGAIVFHQQFYDELSRLDPGATRPRPYLANTPGRPFDFAARGFWRVGALSSDGRGGLFTIGDRKVVHVTAGPVDHALVALRDLRFRPRRLQAVIEATRPGRAVLEVVRRGRVVARSSKGVRAGHATLQTRLHAHSHWYRVRVRFGRSSDEVLVHGARALSVSLARRILEHEGYVTENGGDVYLGRRCRGFGPRRVDCVFRSMDPEFDAPGQSGCAHVASLRLRASGVLLMRAYDCGGFRWERARFERRPRWDPSIGVEALDPFYWLG